MAGMLSVNHLGAVAALACAMAWLCVQTSLVLAEAETPSELHNPNIAFDYFEPRNPEFMPLYEKLQKREVLEELGQFLAPVHWPRKLRLIMKECPAARADVPNMAELIFYNGTEYTLNLCYQLFAFLDKLDPPAALATRQEAVVGGLVGGVLHEAGRAMFDMLKIPVLGSEEDAADQIAGFLGLQFGNDVARTVIKGTYSVWDYYHSLSQSALHPYDVAGKASLAPQRAYNILCIAYGHDAAAFQDLANFAKLPTTRAETCPEEYRQVEDAFQATVLSKGYVNIDLMKQTKSLTWITPGDLKADALPTSH
jgi:hypothetical protein